MFDPNDMINLDDVDVAVVNDSDDHHNVADNREVKAMPSASFN